MWVALYTHKDCLQHDPGTGHPESPSRLEALLGALDHDRFAQLDCIDAPLATREQLLRVHRADLVNDVLQPVARGGLRQLDPDTLLSHGSSHAALRAAGAMCAAIDSVMSKHHRRAFCAVRPPGHHATASAAMGFCLFNNIAVGAAHALAVHGLDRIAIVDFDVHHGNGTEMIFSGDPRVLYTSSHQWPLFPGTGAHSTANAIDVSLVAGSGSAEFRAAYETTVLPALDVFAPQLVLVSAGFDAHRLDPLANLNLENDDFRWVTERLVDVAEKHAHGRLVSTLEGGYSLTAMREAGSAHVAALLAG